MQEENPNATATPPATESKNPAQSFAELRRIAEYARNENEQLKKRLGEMEEKVSRVQAPVHEEEDDNSEPYVDNKRFQKELSKFDERMEKKIDKIAEEKARLMIAEERKADYLRRNPDFNEVMKPEVLEKFIAQYGNIVEPLQEMPDNFARQKIVYETVKTINGFQSKQPQAAAAPKSALQAAFDTRKPQMAYQPGNMASGPFASIGDFSEVGMKNAYDRFKSLQKTVNL